MFRFRKVENALLSSQRALLYVQHLSDRRRFNLTCQEMESVVVSIGLDAIFDRLAGITG
jgi:hypothetical protein